MLSRLARHSHDTRPTKHKHKNILAFLLLVLSLGLLAACAPGHSGERVVAFIRDGKLWTIDPDGNNAFATVSQNTPVVGYAWSPIINSWPFAVWMKTSTKRWKPENS
ncbi:hypothetical protein KDW_57070 [Dictyobacter vulcani]|uniref:Uncharacterized protein n=1 Tax=Dictyobacter vulcani TaxID=2607529 RepID=A0A5J4KUG8_9CHLR|nr:hypothetical protein [Dictyobacter vulcani]GER91545.1 hypothetical protein KDW_57070 [Dictyobacter vulcani]